MASLSYSRMRPVYDEITRLTDTVCHDHVDEEFAMLCRKLVAALARGKAKRETKDRTLATRVCRNCDARFSCSSYREHVQSDRRTGSRAFRELYDDDGLDAKREDRLDASRSVTPSAEELIANR